MPGLSTRDTIKYEASVIIPPPLETIYKIPNSKEHHLLYNLNKNEPGLYSKTSVLSVMLLF